VAIDEVDRRPSAPSDAGRLWRRLVVVGRQEVVKPPYRCHVADVVKDLCVAFTVLGDYSAGMTGFEAALARTDASSS
jgi:hypothetical protein